MCGALEGIVGNTYIYVYKRKSSISSILISTKSEGKKNPKTSKKQNKPETASSASLPKKKKRK